MNKTLSNLLVIVGFCMGAVGATGFQSPTKSMSAEDLAAAEAEGKTFGSTEDLAWPLLIGGLILLSIGGVMGRRRSGSGGSEAHHAGLTEIRTRLDEVRAAVVRLEAESFDDKALLSEIDEMRTGVLFDLGSKSDDFAALVGFDAYAAVWSPFATCERLLNRCWSMTADGHGAEGRAELPLAREAVESAVSAAAAL